MQYLIMALTWLQGKKTAIIAILGLLISYLLGEHMISENLAYLFNGILVILGGSASYATKRLVYGQMQGRKKA